QAENRFSVARFQVLRNGQVLPAAEPGPPGLSARTLISRVIGPHPAPARWGVSVACQEPAAGALISANQKYGGARARAPPGGRPTGQGARSARTLLEAALRPRAGRGGGRPPPAPGGRAGARPRPPRHRRAPSLAPARSPPREPEGMRRESATKLSLQPQSTGVPKALAIPYPCPAPRHNLLKSWLKTIGHVEFGCAAAPQTAASSD